jgi:hypothetical protein
MDDSSEYLAKYKHWWVLIGAAGLVIAGAAATKPFIPGLLIGLGLLFFGVGEWANHPIQMKRSGGKITESYPWNYKYSWGFGLIADVIGIGFFLFGLGRLVAFGP